MGGQPQLVRRAGVTRLVGIARRLYAVVNETEVTIMGVRPRTKAAKKRRVRIKKERRLKAKGVNTLLFRKVSG